MDMMNSAQLMILLAALCSHTTGDATKVCKTQITKCAKDRADLLDRKIRKKNLVMYRCEDAEWHPPMDNNWHRIPSVNAKIEACFKKWNALPLPEWKSDEELYVECGKNGN
jgi:hypothetical protein